MFDFIISYFKKEKVKVDMLTFLFENGNIFVWGRTDGYDELGCCKSIHFELNNKSKELLLQLKEELIRSYIEKESDRD